MELHSDDVKTAELLTLAHVSARETGQCEESSQPESLQEVKRTGLFNSNPKSP